MVSLVAAVEEARHEPWRITELLEAEPAQRALAGLDEDRERSVVFSTLSTIMVEVVYLRALVDTVARMSGRGEGRLPRAERLVATDCTDIYAKKVHPHVWQGEGFPVYPLREDQERFLRSVNGVFDAAYQDVFLNWGGQGITIADERHPYHAVMVEMGHKRPPGGEQLVRETLASMARQQFYNVLFGVEQLMGPWGRMKAPGARQIRRASDLAMAVVNNIRELRTAATLRGLGGMSVLGALNGVPGRSTGVYHYALEKGGQAGLAEYLRIWQEDQASDFRSGFFSRISSWERGLPEVELTLMPRGARTADAADDTRGWRYESERRGPCPARASERIPALLADTVAPAWGQLQDFVGRAGIAGRGLTTSRESLSIIEQVAWTTVHHLPSLVAGRETGTGLTLADERVTFVSLGEAAARAGRGQRSTDTRPLRPAPGPRAARPEAAGRTRVDLRKHPRPTAR
ncbi:hypothetical protein [Streptomonospora mangrovi]|uniref:hypothetical protein n=1 Tax=Streptomonospora mangrovi TaxID=2883123 RepID=UPI0022DDF8B5|nr:hypothetical protein [Streptomonospora mangrovi]